VLGPLVVAGVRVAEEDLPRLWELGARDSKVVPRARRRAVVRALAAVVARGRVVVIPASVVDGDSLTSLELAAAASLVDRLGPGRVVVDAPVAPLAVGRFVAALAARCASPPRAIDAFPKADRDHPAVAAASLLAKVVRDGYVVALRQRFGDFGWGYPGEPKVRQYLASWWAGEGTLPPICRTRWRSIQDLLSPPLRGGGGSCAPDETKGEWAELR